MSETPPTCYVPTDWLTPKGERLANPLADKDRRGADWAASPNVSMNPPNAPMLGPGQQTWAGQWPWRKLGRLPCGSHGAAAAKWHHRQPRTRIPAARSPA